MNSCGGQTIPELGALHRAALWENMMFDSALSIRHLPPSSPIETFDATSGMSTVNLAEATSSLNAAGGTANGIQFSGDVTSNGPKRTMTVHDKTARSSNVIVLKYLIQGMPNTLAPFFQGSSSVTPCMATETDINALAIIKMFHARRSPEAPQKKQIQESAKVIAKILLGYLQTPQFGWYLFPVSLIFLLFSSL